MDSLPWAVAWLAVDRDFEVLSLALGGRIKPSESKLSYDRSNSCRKISTLREKPAPLSKDLFLPCGTLLASWR